ncbi:uncharacterized protein LOC106644769 isoform X2 [Copidosoma floridanum]|uniref:uncharacterized protein LOC106644769 isoform X2 n=1 Tax=Copidosoma floridanum TaxID=29053 RepID=UPI0006C98F69|nr:uncharacterized protein LOC106644769 isoform X2 [Copidosoma floridanum]
MVYRALSDPQVSSWQAIWSVHRRNHETPYQFRAASTKENLVHIQREKDIRRNRKKDSYTFKTPPYILGYTGYIPGYSSRYGLTFMKAVDEGTTEWREAQSKLRSRRDAMRAHVERTNPRNLLSRVRADNVDVEIDHGHGGKRQYFDNQVSAESPPIVGYTGHIPGAKGEIALSKRYGLAAKKGLELFEKEQRSRLLSPTKDADAIDRVLEVANVDDTGHLKP